MADLHRWWEKIPAERYWMEITDRADLGSDLHAPQLDDGGRAYWSYNIVTEARDGDVVLHWHKELLGVPGIVGWSTVSGAPQESEIVWQARGTVGRTHGPSGREPAWLVPLAGYTPLLHPVTQEALRREEAELRALHAELEEEHGRPLYFPFAFSAKRPIRTAQGYLVKCPARVLEVFHELDGVPRASYATRPPRMAPQPAVPGPRYQTDPRVKVAIERHAVERATDYFDALGFTVENVGSFRSYDLHLTLATENRHVEVKGSSGPVDAVELTTNEVKNANEHQPTDLFIVSDIAWSREPDGSITTHGGIERVLHDWKPDPADLTATRYRYAVPARW